MIDADPAKEFPKESSRVVKGDGFADLIIGAARQHGSRAARAMWCSEVHSGRTGSQPAPVGSTLFVARYLSVRPDRLR